MIRFATGRDVDELVRLGYEYYLESNLQGCMFSWLKLAEQFKMAILDTDADVIVNERDGVIAGFSISHVVTPIFSIDTVLENRVLYVAKEYRSTAVGPTLIKNLKKTAKNLGCKYVSLGVSSGIKTDATIRLYRKLGYEQIGADFRLTV